MVAIIIYRVYLQLCTFTESQFTLNITEDGKQLAGDNYTLICSVLPSFNMTNFKWFYESENAISEIENSSHRVVINAPSNSELLFSPLHESHTGVYICQGLNKSIQNTSSHVVNVTSMSLH